MRNPSAIIASLPEPLQQRASKGAEESEYYGFKLESVRVWQSGGALHCLLQFDGTALEFVAPASLAGQTGSPDLPLTVR